uniref:Uncharacterized protein n=1 Tax=Parascaris equorum TaxID=6256 RepID=A0A914RT06_PAREQ
MVKRRCFEVYSVDRSGYWYIQQENGDFIPYESSLHYANIQLQMFPLNDGGQPTLPSNAQGEKVFPTDANHMPIFPLDPKTNQPTFPVDDTGQPVFPSGVNGRAIVPVDSNGTFKYRSVNSGFKFIFAEVDEVLVGFYKSDECLIKELDR